MGRREKRRCRIVAVSFRSVLKGSELATFFHNSTASCAPVGAPHGTQAPAPTNKQVFDGLIARDSASIEIGMDVAPADVPLSKLSLAQPQVKFSI
jgi:hypothetical protein